MQPIIVGIDPGTTSAFAVLSFDFEVLKIKSKKEYSLAGLISDIYKEGNPILVGTDKKEIPSFIKEFSQKTGAKIYFPRYDTKKGEKLHIVKEKGFSELVKNTHETDALASAIFAYNEYLPLIKKIKNFVKENNKQDIQDKLIVTVLCREISIAKAVSEIEKKPVKKIIEEKRIVMLPKEKVLTTEEKEILLLRTNIENLKNSLRLLKQENLLLKQKKIDINKETKNLISFKESRAIFLEKENKKLKEEISKKEKIIRRLDEFIAKSRNSILIKKLKNLGIEEYKKRQNILRIEKEDVLLVDDLSIISNAICNKLKEYVKVIIYEKGNEKTELNEFVLIKKSNFNLVETKYFCLAEKNQFEKVLNETLKSRKKDMGFIKDILEEYKRERFSDDIK